MTSAIVFLIKQYQKFIRPALPCSCRFHPSCSEYASQSLQRLGLFRGIFKAAGRILRCSPLSPGGF